MPLRSACGRSRVDIANYPIVGARHQGRQRPQHRRGTADRSRSSSARRRSVAARTTRWRTTTTQRPHEMGWTMVSGDIQRSIDGVCSVRARPIGWHHWCATTWQIDLAIPLPGFVKRRAEVRILNTVRELKVRAEAVSAGIGADTACRHRRRRHQGARGGDRRSTATSLDEQTSGRRRGATTASSR